MGNTLSQVDWTVRMCSGVMTSPALRPLAKGNLLLSVRTRCVSEISPQGLFCFVCFSHPAHAGRVSIEPRRRERWGWLFGLLTSSRSLAVIAATPRRLEPISISLMSRVVAKTGWMLGARRSQAWAAWQGGQQRRRRAAARSRGPACGDATAEACKGSRIVAARIARSRVAPPRYARRHCSAVRERLWSATLRDRAISAQGVVTFVLVYVKYTASSAPSPAPK